ncbi:hypothetical protein swp_3774 [Shewanella piezotolerans WP3]|uniref:Uncharacterized protein n=1 Tax=Shewanella piezotolerans (strain WP3 / JCM 13877) TaxID=225849 RepID=B8CQI9_SHEPW|nr:hypothetical protein swp_3774 [Shewanella piezotolerans WP3]
MGKATTLSFLKYQAQRDKSNRFEVQTSYLAPQILPNNDSSLKLIVPIVNAINVTYSNIGLSYS